MGFVLLANHEATPLPAARVRGRFSTISASARIASAGCVGLAGMVDSFQDSQRGALDSSVGRRRSQFPRAKKAHASDETARVRDATLRRASYGE